MGEEVEGPKVPCTGEVFTTNPPKCVHWVALHREIESLRASLTRAQYTCEAHASEVLKGGECVWCTLTRVEEERDEAVKALEPFAEIGAGVAKEGDGVWRRRWRGSVTNHGKEPEVIFREYEPFIKAHDVSTRLSRATHAEDKS